MKNQNVNFNNTDQFYNQKPVLIDATSLNSFFMDVTQYIYEMQHGERGILTARSIVLNAMRDIVMHDSDTVKAYSQTVDMMADLGWLDLKPIGTTFDDELLYELSPIEKE